MAQDRLAAQRLSHVTAAGGSTSCRKKKHEIDVFDRRGHFLKTVGVRGFGPGEFQAIGLIIIAKGDTLHVFDGRTRRRTLLDPEGRFVREDPATGTPNSGFASIGGEIIVSGHFPTPENLGYSLHALRMDGSVRASFGSTTAVFRENMFYLLQRNVAPSRSGQVWTSHYIQYVIEEWTTANRLLRRIVRDADWFRPQVMQRNMTLQTKEYPLLRGVQEDTRARLWTIVQVNEDDWWKGLGPLQGSAEGAYHPLTDIDKVYASRVEVLDPVSGKLITSLRTEEFLLWFVGPGLVVGYRENDNGVPRVLVFRLNLREPERR